MSERPCWFKTDDEAPWIRGHFHAWGTKSERAGDYSYGWSAAIVEDVQMGRVFLVDLKHLSFGTGQPRD